MIVHLKGSRKGKAGIKRAAKKMRLKVAAFAAMSFSHKHAPYPICQFAASGEQNLRVSTAAEGKLVGGRDFHLSSESKWRWGVGVAGLLTPTKFEIDAHE